MGAQAAAGARAIRGLVIAGAASAMAAAAAAACGIFAPLDDHASSTDAAADAADAGSTTDGGGANDVAAEGGCDGINLNTDPTNCGACGFDCRGGACSFGLCGSVDVMIGGSAIQGVAVDAQNVFWVATNGGVFRALLDGSQATRIANVGDGVGLAIDGDFAFFARRALQQIVRVPRDGSAQLTLLDAGAQPFGVAVEGTNLWYSAAQTVYRTQKVPGDGGVPVAHPLNGANYLDVVDGTIYWAELNSNRIYAQAPDAGEVLLRDTNALGIAVSGSHLFWTTDDGEVWVAPLAGGAPRLLASTGATVSDVAFEPTTSSVYFGVEGTLKRLAVRF